MDDLVTWLRAQLDDDERVARGATRWSEGVAEWAAQGEPDWEHIARHDPARVLAEVDAKGRILDFHAIEVKVVDAPAFNPVTGERISDEYDVTCAVCGWVSSDPASACPTVRLLALPYADRPGYREDWRP